MGIGESGRGCGCPVRCEGSRVHSVMLKRHRRLLVSVVVRIIWIRDNGSDSAKIQKEHTKEVGTRARSRSVIKHHSKNKAQIQGVIESVA